MICTEYNEQIRDLIYQTEILWRCTLSDGTEVWSDYCNTPDPWLRLKAHCGGDLKVVKAEVLVMGAPVTTVFENPDGLEGLYILRGMVRDLNDPTNNNKTMTFACLDESLKHLNVRKFSFPECRFYTETRLITEKNMELMLIGSETKSKIEVFVG